MSERRRYERVPFFCDVSLTLLPGAKTIEAHSFDISLGGVGLVTQIAVELGRTVSLAFTLHDKMGKNVVNVVNGRVMRYDADGDSNRLGIEFLTPLTEEACPQLIQRIMKI